jgi:hypothetical protein
MRKSIDRILIIWHNTDRKKCQKVFRMAKLLQYICSGIPGKFPLGETYEDTRS